MYLSWDKKTISDFSDANITDLYNKGFLFTRQGKGEMYQTRSVRIELSQFELNSENKRILRKTEDLNLTTSSLPLKEYDWHIAKLGKDFYEKKFGEKTFSANKIKELLTDPDKSNFNELMTFVCDQETGYAICYTNPNIVHYSYPFYNPEIENKNTGLGMMTRAVMWAKENNKKYIYLGSAQRSSDTYKLQFKGLEWFDGKNWQTDLEELKKILKQL